MLYSRTTSAEVEAVVDRLRTAVSDHQFGVLGEIDLTAKMKEKGVPFDRRCVILEVCNPRQAKRILEQNMAISTALPCRICVYEDQGEVTVTTLRPTKLLRMYEQAGPLDEVAGEVEDALVAIIGDACDRAEARAV